MLTIITQTYTWSTTITTTTTVAATTTKTRKKYPTKNTDEKKFTFNIPLEKRESRELLERKKERKKDKKKNTPFPFYPPNHFSFWWNQRRFPTGFSFRASTIHESSRSFGFSTNRHTGLGKGAVFCFPPPLFIRRPSVAIPHGGEEKAKMYFSRTIRGNRKSSTPLKLPLLSLPARKCSLFKRYSARIGAGESVAIFVFTHR